MQCVDWGMASDVFLEDEADAKPIPSRFFFRRETSALSSDEIDDVWCLRTYPHRPGQVSAKLLHCTSTKLMHVQLTDQTAFQMQWDSGMLTSRWWAKELQQRFSVGSL